MTTAWMTRWMQHAVRVICSLSSSDVKMSQRERQESKSDHLMVTWSRAARMKAALSIWCNNNWSCGYSKKLLSLIIDYNLWEKLSGGKETTRFGIGGWRRVPSFDADCQKFWRVLKGGILYPVFMMQQSACHSDVIGLNFHVTRANSNHSYDDDDDPNLHILQDSEGPRPGVWPDAFIIPPPSFNVSELWTLKIQSQILIKIDLKVRLRTVTKCNNPKW